MSLSLTEHLYEVTIGMPCRPMGDRRASCQRLPCVTHHKVFFSERREPSRGVDIPAERVPAHDNGRAERPPLHVNMSYSDHSHHRRDGGKGRGRPAQPQQHALSRQEAQAQPSNRQHNVCADHPKRAPSERGTPTSSSARSPHAARQRRNDETAQNLSACASGAQAEQAGRLQQAPGEHHTMFSALGEPPAAYSQHASANASRMPSPSSATAQSEVRKSATNKESHITSGAHDMHVRELVFWLAACWIA